MVAPSSFSPFFRALLMATTSAHFPCQPGILGTLDSISFKVFLIQDAIF